MRYLFLALLLTSCGAVQPLVDALPSDTPTRVIYGQSGMQCSTVVVDPHMAITANHCVRDSGGAIVIVLPAGPVPVAQALSHDSLDLAILVTKDAMGGPYAKLGPVPAPGQMASVEGYGCDRVVPTIPKFSQRPVQFLVVDPLSSDLVFKGRACKGDSGGGVYNEAGELVGISSTIGQVEDGTWLLMAAPVQSLTSAAQ